MVATIYCSINYGLTVLDLVNADAQGPATHGVGAPPYGCVGFRDRVLRVLGLLLFLSAL